MDINIEEMKKLIELMNENELVEIMVEEKGRKLHLKKAGAIQVISGQPVALGPSPASAPAPGVVPVNSGATSQDKKDELYVVKSPLVGTFYRAPKPESPPFVEEGQNVTKGQTLCIIEAMKVMNEIKSDVNGIIKEICVKNAEPVDFGRVLFKIKVEQ